MINSKKDLTSLKETVRSCFMLDFLSECYFEGSFFTNNLYPQAGRFIWFDDSTSFEKIHLLP